jgi:hypothetical protein
MRRRYDDGLSSIASTSSLTAYAHLQRIMRPLSMYYFEVKESAVINSRVMIRLGLAFKLLDTPILQGWHYILVTDNGPDNPCTSNSWSNDI